MPLVWPPLRRVIQAADQVNGSRFGLPRHGWNLGSNHVGVALEPLGGRQPAKRTNPFVAPLRGPWTHSLVVRALFDRALFDRGMSQYWLVRSADFCRYGQASLSLRLSHHAALIG
jgi:hypothetical protein